MNPLYYLPKGIQSVTLDATITDGYNHCILVEAQGDINVEYEDGTTHVWTFTATPGYLWGIFNKVLSTSTTIGASDIYAMKVGIK